MRALDTNILARLMLNDDEAQAAAAADLVRERFVISHTVLLELAWLLSFRVGLDRQRIAMALRDITSLPTIVIDDVNLVSWAIDRFEAGADFADMLHIATAKPAHVFVSFDRQLARRAGANAPVRVELLR